MSDEFDISGRKVTADVVRRGGELRLDIGGNSHAAALRPLGNGEYRLDLDGRPRRVWIARDGDDVHIHLGGRTWSVRRLEPERAGGAGGGGASEDVATAPMPGVVLTVPVKEGDRVRVGQTLIVIESMKMETPIPAWRDGVVARIHHEEGASFDRNAPLVALEPEGDV